MAADARTMKEDTATSAAATLKSQHSQPKTVMGTTKNATVTAASWLHNVSLSVSHLTYDVDIEVLWAQIKENADVSNVDITCKMQPQRHSNYKSCKIKMKGMPMERITGLYEPENWDEDILVR